MCREKEKEIEREREGETEKEGGRGKEKEERKGERREEERREKTSEEMYESKGRMCGDDLGSNFERFSKEREREKRKEDVREIYLSTHSVGGERERKRRRRKRKRREEEQEEGKRRKTDESDVRSQISLRSIEFLFRLIELRHAKPSETRYLYPILEASPLSKLEELKFGLEKKKWNLKERKDRREGSVKRSGERSEGGGEEKEKRENREEQCSILLIENVIQCVEVWVSCKHSPPIQPTQTYIHTHPPTRTLT